MFKVITDSAVLEDEGPEPGAFKDYWKTFAQFKAFTGKEYDLNALVEAVIDKFIDARRAEKSAPWSNDEIERIQVSVIDTVTTFLHRQYVEHESIGKWEVPATLVND